MNSIKFVLYKYLCFCAKTISKLMQLNANLLFLSLTCESFLLGHFVICCSAILLSLSINSCTCNYVFITSFQLLNVLIPFSIHCRLSILWKEWLNGWRLVALFSSENLASINLETVSERTTQHITGSPDITQRFLLYNNTTFFDICYSEVYSY